jgi:hypothetical protein
MNDQIALLVGRMIERRRGRDRRPAAVLAREMAGEITAPDLFNAFCEQLIKAFLRQARAEALTEDPSDAVTLSLPFEPFEGAIGAYTTGRLVRILREDGNADYVSPHIVTGLQIRQATKWEKLLRARQHAEMVTREQNNDAHDHELRLLGFEPDTQTVEDMHAQPDTRRCVLCGDGPRSGDPWQLEHEESVAYSDGRPTRIGWAHRSCNQTKGAATLKHEVFATK